MEKPKTDRGYCGITYDGVSITFVCDTEKDQRKCKHSIRNSLLPMISDNQFRCVFLNEGCCRSADGQIDAIKWTHDRVTSGVELANTNFYKKIKELEDLADKQSAKK